MLKLKDSFAAGGKMFVKLQIFCNLTRHDFCQAVTIVTNSSSSERCFLKRYHRLVKIYFDKSLRVVDMNKRNLLISNSISDERVINLWLLSPLKF